MSALVVQTQFSETLLDNTSTNGAGHLDSTQVPSFSSVSGSDCVQVVKSQCEDNGDDDDEAVGDLTNMFAEPLGSQSTDPMDTNVVEDQSCNEDSRDASITEQPDQSSADTAQPAVNTAQSLPVSTESPVQSPVQSPHPHHNTNNNNNTAASTKRAKMDGDGDGAPSCSSTDASPRRQKGLVDKGQGDGGQSEASPPPRRDSSRMSTSMTAACTPRSGRPSNPGDLSQLNMTSSWAGSDSGGSAKGETVNLNATKGGIGYTRLFRKRAGMLADPAKIAREREKEERVKQARERLQEERKKKLEELREQQRLAQENREKQLELRRRKIEDLRRRDSERRQAVEDRRKMKEEMEKVRRESVLQRAEERMARYEAWKAGGRKGMFGQDGSGTPRHLSMSTSVLYHKKEASGAALASPAHCRPESAPGHRISLGVPSPSGYTSSPGGPSPVRMRERAGPRRPRPNSVASSMPSYMSSEPAKSPRCRSSDRGLARDGAKPRPSRKSRDKSDLNKSRDGDGDKDTQNKGARENSKNRSSSFFDRLSTPKLKKLGQESTEEKEKSPRNVNVPAVRVQFVDDKSTSSSTEPQRGSLGSKPSLTKDNSSVKASSSKEKVVPKEKEAKPAQSKPVPAKPKAKEAPKAKEPKEPKEVKEVKDTARARASSPGGGARSGGSTPRVTPPPSASATPTHHSQPAGEDGTTTPRSAGPQDITAEEYKQRLAEKRKQAREAREREAEEERRRQEEERLAQEERDRQEEEEQRRMEEEASLLAAQAREAEEERLRLAIEAEEKRKAEEAIRLEAERLAKEEADKKAKEEAERLEKEKQEKARREEEERLQRKKKLEMIMKRVKPADASAAAAGDKTDANKSGTSSPAAQTPGTTAENSPEEHAKPITTETPPSEAGTPAAAISTTEGTSRSGTSSPSSETVNPASFPTDMSASFTEGVVPRSASLGDFLDDSKKNDGGMSTSMSTPVKSSDNLLGDSTTTPTSEAKPRFKSPLLQSLVGDKANNGGDSSANGSPKFKSPLLNSLLGKNKVGARMALSASMEHLAQKDGRASPGANNASSEKESSKAGHEEDKDEDTSGHQGSSGVSNGVNSMVDSALGSSVGPQLDSPQGSQVNGHRNGLDDSSIVLTPPGGQPQPVTDGQFEEYIDLLDGSGDKPRPHASHAPPIIAFDENRRADVTESLS